MQNEAFAPTDKQSNIIETEYSIAGIELQEVKDSPDNLLLLFELVDSREHGKENYKIYVDTEPLPAVLIATFARRHDYGLKALTCGVNIIGSLASPEIVVVPNCPNEPQLVRENPHNFCLNVPPPKA